MHARMLVKKPRWIWLYALVPVAFLLLCGADLIPESGIWRVLAECCAVIAVCILAKTWVSANRLALTEMNARTPAESEADSPEALQEFSGRNGRIQAQPFATARTSLRMVR
jgi:hypothetical protein